MSVNSWVSRLQPFKVSKITKQFRVRYNTKSELQCYSACDIYDHFASAMSYFFGGESQAKQHLGDVNYSILKEQIMWMLLDNDSDREWSALEKEAQRLMDEDAETNSKRSEEKKKIFWDYIDDACDNVTYTVPQDLVFNMDLVKTVVTNPYTGGITNCITPIFSLKAPVLEINGKLSAGDFYSFHGFMSPLQEVIVTDITDNDKAVIFHESLHSLVKDVRQTLDNEMYGATEADQREEILVHLVSDKFESLSKYYNDLCHGSVKTQTEVVDIDHTVIDNTKVHDSKVSEKYALDCAFNRSMNDVRVAYSKENFRTVRSNTRSSLLNEFRSDTSEGKLKFFERAIRKMSILDNAYPVIRSFSDEQQANGVKTVIQRLKQSYLNHKNG